MANHTQGDSCWDQGYDHRHSEKGVLLTWELEGVIQAKQEGEGPCRGNWGSSEGQKEIHWNFHLKNGLE